MAPATRDCVIPHFSSVFHSPSSSPSVSKAATEAASRATSLIHTGSASLTLDYSLAVNIRFRIVRSMRNNNNNKEGVISKQTRHETK